MYFAGSLLETVYIRGVGNVVQSARELVIWVPYVALSLAAIFGTAER